MYRHAAMTAPLSFVPAREVWFVSAFVDATALDPYARAEELGAQVQARVRALTEADLARVAHAPELVRVGLDMARSATIRCAWHLYADGFPFCDENTGLVFTKLGWFEFEVEYFADAPARRAEIDPLLVQQPPTAALELLRQLSTLKGNAALRLDVTSPIFVFVVSDDVRPDAPSWTAEQVRAHRRAIGAWTDVYSGAWPDYTEELYERRVAGNLSNRLSEIHLIRKNSGFLYMAPENRRRFFDGYMRPYVLAPTAQLRALHHATIAVQDSLDILLMRQAREDFQDVAAIEAKLRGLRQLRAALQVRMSEIYNELDSNKRQHYSAVLRHLLEEFNLHRGGLFARVGEKFDALHDGLLHLYQRREAMNQERTERRLGLLNTLFSLGVLADFAALLVGTEASVRSEDPFAAAIYGAFSAVLLVVLVLAIALRIRLRLEDRRARPAVAADALILDDQGRVLVITRTSPPFRGQRAFPGTLVQDGGAVEAALVREVKDETNLDVRDLRPLGTYDAPGRDPRGRIASRAFLCRLAPGPYALRCREDAGEARFVPLDELAREDLAFDHEDMLADAIRLLRASA